MKLPPAFRIFVVLIIIIVALNLCDTQSTQKATCKRRINRNCRSTTKSCARIGRSNICIKYRNDCKRRLANCGVSANRRNRKVAASYCEDMQLNQRTACNTANSTITSPTTTST